ncbi:MULTISPECIES: hypothetical protein [unclassified Streptomyces]
MADEREDGVEPMAVADAVLRRRCWSGYAAVGGLLVVLNCGWTG